MIKISCVSLVLISVTICNALREFRLFSTRSVCETARDPNYPFAYSKYLGQEVESKPRVNSNLQDFRHQCQVLGGQSKCSICEDIECNSDTGICSLQLQGVNSTDMSINIPTVSDTAWAVGGDFRYDFGGTDVSHFCVFISSGECLLPNTTNFENCTTRCFGYGFPKPAVRAQASFRSVVDTYPGMGRWKDDGAVDLWVYPSNCEELQEFQNLTCSYSGPINKTPSFNPQGFAFTLAGSGKEGLLDGTGTEARFTAPEDVAVDEYGVVYVADTQNNAIRMISTTGEVSTIAGKGPEISGFKDGKCADATFSMPKGLDVRHEWIEGKYITVILVADTGNHRIRRIEYNSTTAACHVRCLTGLCGNNTLSASGIDSPAAPLTGFADGSGLEARFSAPESVAFMEGDYFAVADTGNFLIRWVIASNGSTFTLAGHLVNGETDPNGDPLAGCTPPCLAGQQGFRDGNLTYAEFYNPLDVTRGPNNTVWVVDEQRVRIVELPGVVSEIYGIRSTGRVSTIAGTSLQGVEDGAADVSNFFYSSGVFVTSDNLAYVVDSVSCRVRRISPYPSVAENIGCSTPAVELIRPSGCTSFDQPIDKIGRKVSRVEANIQYNFGYPYDHDLDRGKYIKNCVGVPPRDVLDKRFVNVTGDNLVIDDLRVAVNEHSEQGMAILVNCPNSCGTTSGTGILEGNHWYSERSSVCQAAVHYGALKAGVGGLVQIVIERRDFLDRNGYTAYVNGTLQNNLTSTDIPDNNVFRVFNITPYNISNSMVHTSAGNPSAPLENGCGFKDAQPATKAKYNLPSGIAASYQNGSLSDINFLYIADTNNHRIRGLSATCTQICENGGRCAGPDICQCPTGWTGIDCTKPTCDSPCGDNTVCVAPNTCACKPGFGGTDCNTALCVQECRNGGVCSAPDTCSCATGWFDTNCTTPVCKQTCANGGNCTAPDTCACPSEWTGPDCRVPVCRQTCQNSGYCVAPNTCACPPQWINHDCSVPVCTQGLFQAHNPPETSNDLFAITAKAWPTYKNCDLQSWCNATNEFECDQEEYFYDILRVPSGPEFRAVTGRKVPPTQCMNVELPIWFKAPFQLLYSDNTTTGDVRYSPFSPYTTNPANPWRGYLEPTSGRTGPWTYTPDRQVANVNWLNVSQGVYVCANEGSCVSPGVCSCAYGWSGFDCRTPICSQGYYTANQTRYVSGMETSTEVDRFETYLGDNNGSYRLQWPYSNPNYTMQFEFYEGPSIVTRETRNFTGQRYYGPVAFDGSGDFDPELQGGFRCTIRADTQWENETYMFQHPNFYSRYMDTKVQEDGVTYTFWQNFSWPPVHRKSRVLDKYEFNISFAYTNEGYLRAGIWNRTGNNWEFGVCIIEFDRNCSSAPEKELDLESNLFNVFVQDTDLSYRPQITYSDLRVTARGRWNQQGGDCIDQVVRGCANNGTCIAPDTCRCAEGWTGGDCRTPICEQICLHNGNCTGPNTCTCERGWTDFDCSVPICAQECQNGGFCVAPDTCKCKQWPNEFRDGRVAGGRPLYQDGNGDPLPTGFTGYDCSVPICVQAETFLFNVPSASDPGFVELGGHGGDALLTCTNTETGETLPRCPQFDEYVTGNDGKSFQTGCGWDPYDTGCCREFENTVIICYKCDDDLKIERDGTFYCNGPFTELIGTTTEKDKFTEFLDEFGNFLLCGKYHSPRNYDPDVTPRDYGVAAYYYNIPDPEKSVFNFASNWTSNRFLCNVFEWVQGDYIDDASLGDMTGVGSIYPFRSGRHVRDNYPNILVNEATQNFTELGRVEGEGVYRCFNGGSCVGPDTCTCTDGYEGFDCDTPLCRHLQVTGDVSSCLNGGICTSKDECKCIQTTSVLWEVHPDAARGITGWTGTDCSMPMCVQGYYDPFCSDLPQAPGGEGCYRCANKGNCTAPDICTCAEGWTGFDCRTPVCEVVADPLTRTQLATVFEDKVIAFESDPCGVEAIYGRRGWKGRKYARGNCTEPNQCTCLCKIPYHEKMCKKTGRRCNGPWQDPLVQLRDLLHGRGEEYTFGSTDCRYGYEGNVDELERFTTCHQTIYFPTATEHASVALIVSFSVCGFIALVLYRYASVRLRRRFLLAKIERRRSKRSSADSLLSGDRGDFQAT